MGHYTKLKCKSKIKPEYREAIKKIIFEKALWKDYFAHDFVELPRAHMIPFGENELKTSEIFDGINLHIQCSIKNYNDEIETFFKMLKIISDEITEYKTYNEEDYDYIEQVGGTVEVQKWYDHLTDKYEEVKKIIN